MSIRLLSVATFVFLGTKVVGFGGQLAKKMGGQWCLLTTDFREWGATTFELLNHDRPLEVKLRERATTPLKDCKVWSRCCSDWEGVGLRHVEVEESQQRQIGLDERNEKSNAC